MALNNIKQPGSYEGEVHLNAKNHIYKHLMRCKEPNQRTLSVRVRCEDGALHSGRFWRCYNSSVVKDWQTNWKSVYLELPIRRIGRFDLALLFKDFQTKIVKEEASGESKRDSMVKAFKETSFYKSSIIPPPWVADMVAFLQNDSAQKIEFPASLNSGERRELHVFANEFGFIHDSFGRGSFRRLRLTKQAAKHEVEASGIGVIEVLSTSEMSSDKINQLDKNNIPYVEVKVTKNFYSGPLAWTPDKPLVAWRCSTKWICDECHSSLQSRLKFTKLCAVVDIYCPLGVRRRKVYSLLEKNGEGGNEPKYYLTVIQQTIQPYMFQADLNRGSMSDSLLLGSSNDLNEIHRLYQKSLANINLQGAIIQETLSWPGENVDDLCRSVSYDKRIVTPYLLFSFIDLQHRPRLKWSDSAWRDITAVNWN